MRAVFINPERCIGCRQCEFACAVAHSASHDPAAAVTEDPPPRSRIHVFAGPGLSLSLPMKCRHCDPAPCVGACPTGAMYRDAEAGLVLTAPEQCIACAMCAMVCPFDAIRFHAHANGSPRREVATKCDGCIVRLRDHRPPACVEACKVGALAFGELNDLIASGCASEASAVLAAGAANEALFHTVPASVAGWRAWGSSATRVNEESCHGQQ